MFELNIKAAEVPVDFKHKDRLKNNLDRHSDASSPLNADAQTDRVIQIVLNAPCDSFVFLTLSL